MSTQRPIKSPKKPILVAKTTKVNSTKSSHGLTSMSPRSNKPKNVPTSPRTDVPAIVPQRERQLGVMQEIKSSQGLESPRSPRNIGSSRNYSPRNNSKPLSPTQSGQTPPKKESEESLKKQIRDLSRINFQQTQLIKKFHSELVRAELVTGNKAPISSPSESTSQNANLGSRLEYIIENYINQDKKLKSPGGAPNENQPDNQLNDERALQADEICKKELGENYSTDKLKEILQQKQVSHDENSVVTRDANISFANDMDTQLGNSVRGIFNENDNDDIVNKVKQFKGFAESVRGIFNQDDNDEAILRTIQSNKDSANDNSTVAELSSQIQQLSGNTETPNGPVDENEIVQNLNKLHKQELDDKDSQICQLSKDNEDLKNQIESKDNEIQNLNLTLDNNNKDRTQEKENLERQLHQKAEELENAYKQIEQKGLETDQQRRDRELSSSIREIFTNDPDENIPGYIRKDIHLASSIRGIYQSGDDPYMIDDIRQARSNQGQIDNLRNELNEKQRALDQKNGEFNEHIQSHQSKVDELQNQINNLQNELNEKQRALDQKNGEFNEHIQSHQSKVDELQNQINNLQNELNEKQRALDQKNGEFNEHIQSHQSKVDELQNQINNLQNELNEKQRALDQKNGEFDELQNQIKNLQNEVSKKESQNNELQNTIGDKERQLNDLKQLCSNSNDLGNEVVRLKEEIETKNKEIEIKSNEIQELKNFEDEANQLREELSRLKGENDQKENELNEDIQSKQNEIDEMNKKLQQQENEIKEIKTKLEQKQKEIDGYNDREDQKNKKIAKLEEDLHVSLQKQEELQSKLDKILTQGNIGLDEFTQGQLNEVTQKHNDSQEQSNTANQELEKIKNELVDSQNQLRIATETNENVIKINKEEYDKLQSKLQEFIENADKAKDQATKAAHRIDSLLKENNELRREKEEFISDQENSSITFKRENEETVNFANQVRALFDKNDDSNLDHYSSLRDNDKEIIELIKHLKAPRKSQNLYEEVGRLFHKDASEEQIKEHAQRVAEAAKEFHDLPLSKDALNDLFKEASGKDLNNLVEQMRNDPNESIRKNAEILSNALKDSRMTTEAEGMIATTLAMFLEQMGNAQQ
ncbi:hypothetical protein M9Y10_013027 [Tritrichomonas musculus]|uniref:Viral A-type inclusion protein n=1 Tax=Tritrichomonas musculus TaxID=1915356 RepID=A0ABR2I7B1_9EUKA